MVNRIKAIIYALGISSSCIIKKNKLGIVADESIKCFLNSYLNDILGSIIFMLYLSIVLSFLNIKFTIKLIHVELTALIIDLRLEYLTLLYRNDTVSDPFDLLAYMAGVLLFWYICDGNSLMNNKIKRN